MCQQLLQGQVAGLPSQCDVLEGAQACSNAHARTNSFQVHSLTTWGSHMKLMIQKTMCVLCRTSPKCIHWGRCLGGAHLVLLVSVQSAPLERNSPASPSPSESSREHACSYDLIGLYTRTHTQRFACTSH